MNDIQRYEFLRRELYDDYVLSSTTVSSRTLPEGFKVYECTDCQTLNVIKDNGEITVGFCSNCEHPLWND